MATLDGGQKIALGLVICLEALLLLAIVQSNIPANLTPAKLMLLSGLQATTFVIGSHALVLFVVVAILARRFTITAVTLSLLLAANLLLTPLVSRSPTFVTLPPNLDRKIKIVGDVMPGFTGISRITTDEKGFRTTKTIDYDSNDSYRVFAIGGSTTEQIHISDEKTWTALLEERLQAVTSEPVEVINTGVAGLRAVHHHATLLEILQYSPDVVIFMMGLNDWNKQIAENFSSEFAKEGVLPNFAADRSIFWRAMEILMSLVLNRGSGQNEGGVEDYDGSYYSSQNDSLGRTDIREFAVAEVSSDYRKWITEILSVCRTERIACVFVDQPTAYQSSIDPELRSRLWMTPPNQSYTLTLEGMSAVANTYNHWLQTKVEENGVKSCSIASMVPPTTAYFYDDCHFNEGGAQLVAELIYRCLNQTKDS